MMFRFASARSLVSRPVSRAVFTQPLMRRSIHQSFIRLNAANDVPQLTQEDVLTRSIQVLKNFDIKTQDIGLETKFQQDLGFDSLDANDALVALEEEFDVVFDDKTANDIKSVGEVVTYVLNNYLPAEQNINESLR